MDEKTIGILSYIGPIGLVVAILMDKEKTPFTRFHIRQNIGIAIVWIAIYVVSIIMGRISGVLGMAFLFLNILPFIMWIIGIIGAVNGEKKLAPVLGDKFQEWFKSV
jgi:uncharacterized membrane protein